MLTLIDHDNLDKMIAEKYISVQKHPTLDLYIYNYTQRAQFDRVWNNETMQCRGLIMDGNRNIVSRPFRKFFNLGELLNNPDVELPDLNTAQFVATEKMDGSLGISYFDSDGKMYIATRGSFVSDQAKKANEILLSNYPDLNLNEDFTFLWEIIYPENRIVVNYGEREELVLLAIIDTETGEEKPYDTVKRLGQTKNIPYVQQFDGITDFDKIEQKPNFEGYVIHFPSTGLRFKVKFDEYVRLHKIITGINAKRVWEILSTGGSLDDILDRVPDEFFAWVKETEKRLRSEYDTIEEEALVFYHTVLKHKDTRKEQAQLVLGQRNINSSLLFIMLDEKPYSAQIWKLIEPKFERPFKVEVE